MKATEISKILKKEIANFNNQTELKEVGQGR